MKQIWDKTEEGQNAQLFIKLFALLVLGSNYNWYRLESYWRFVCLSGTLKYLYRAFKYVKNVKYVKMTVHPVYFFLSLSFKTISILQYIIQIKRSENRISYWRKSDILLKKIGYPIFNKLGRKLSRFKKSLQGLT